MRESETYVREEVRGSEKELTLEDQMLEQSGYTSHGEWQRYVTADTVHTHTHIHTNTNTNTHTHD